MKLPLNLVNLKGSLSVIPGDCSCFYALGNFSVRKQCCVVSVNSISLKYLDLNTNALHWNVGILAWRMLKMSYGNFLIEHCYIIKVIFIYLELFLTILQSPIEKEIKLKRHGGAESLRQRHIINSTRCIN